MKDNVIEFLKLYNDLDEYLRKYYRNDSLNYSAINRYINQIKENPNYDGEERSEKLDMIRLLRNNLVHDYDMNSANLITINPETIEFLKKEIEYFSNPLMAKDICVKKENIVFASLDQKISELASMMFLKGFTQLPVLNEDGSLFGAFSPNCIYRYLAKEKGEIHRDFCLNDIKQYLPLEEHVSEFYLYVSEQTSIDTIVDKFDSYYRRGKKLSMAFVTKGGTKEGELVGLIVANDLVKIRR